MVCQLRFVFGYGIDEVMTEVPLGRAFAEQAYCIENDAVTRAFGSIRRKGKGYIGIQVDEMMAQLK